MLTGRHKGGNISTSDLWRFSKVRLGNIEDKQMMAPCYYADVVSSASLLIKHRLL
jgi:hypothetical protein